MRDIVLEGPDNAGKSTLAAELAKVFDMRVIPSEGREKYPGEMNERVARYAQEYRGVIFDRHPVISQKIYAEVKQNTPVDDYLEKEFYERKPFIIYCRAVDGRGMEGHVEKEYDDPEYVAEIERKYEKLCELYDKHILPVAHLVYRIGFDLNHTINSVIESIIMNVDDFNNDIIPTDFSQRDMLDQIFDQQLKHAKEYLPIEKENNLLDTDSIPVSVHDRHGQKRLKHFAECTMEELYESANACRTHPEIVNHQIEELSDALHFLVEFYVLAGIKPDSFVKTPHFDEPSADKLQQIFDEVEPRSLDQGIYETGYHLFTACNCLKNKPWKRTHQLTDVPVFEKAARYALRELIATFKGYGLEAKDIFAIYFKKTAVNDFRKRSRY